MILASRIFAFCIAFLVVYPCYGVEKMVNKGKEGAWLSVEELDKALAERKELKILKEEKIPLLELEISKYKVLVEQKDMELKIVDDMMKKKDELYEAGLKLQQAEVDKLQLKLDRMEKWYRSPSVYLISGVLLGGALSVGLAYGLND
jgi:hypothetical protein